MARKSFAKGAILLGMGLLLPSLGFLGPSNAQAGQKALLVGVGTYPHSPSSNLRGPAIDLANMKTFLKQSWGFSDRDIGILKDSQATKKAIMHGLKDWLPNNTKPGDRVVIYYSGHGGQVTDRNGDEQDGKDEFISTADVGKGGKRTVDQLVIDDELGAALGKLANREVIFISDSCHSGTVTRGLTLSEGDEADITPRFMSFEDDDVKDAASRQTLQAPGRDEEPLSRDIKAHLTISAAMPHQYSWDSSEGGIFTRYLVEALQNDRADTNHNGRITSAELINYIKPRTESWCEKREKCRQVHFTPNIDPKNETFVMTPYKQGPLQTATVETNDEVSDILPPLQQDALEIVIKPQADQTLGDEVSFEIKSSFGGYLTLLDLNAANEMILLFPTAEDLAHGKTGKIRAKAPLRVPDASYGFAFEAGLPTGKGQLLAIVTQDKIDFEALLKANRDFEPVKDRAALAKKISEKLYSVWTGEENFNRAVKWAVGYKDYSISK
ncbi:caspase family protein [uncultured Cohaesibacter sp.]|uniref:caspase family protein n=1 Tax=uncultured Cohaesibacter sp. TaxID=1002546 RepID=UPI00293107B6|nr:caspase family protein [uncultured Cohaesibacter sp.]